MIEVTAKLVRGHVFLSGEVVECIITFSHPVSPTHKVLISLLLKPTKLEPHL